MTTYMEHFGDIDKLREAFVQNSDVDALILELSCMSTDAICEHFARVKQVLSENRHVFEQFYGKYVAAFGDQYALLSDCAARYRSQKSIRNRSDLTSSAEELYTEYNMVFIMLSMSLLSKSQLNPLIQTIQQITTLPPLLTSQYRAPQLFFYIL